MVVLKAPADSPVAIGLPGVSYPGPSRPPRAGDKASKVAPEKQPVYRGEFEVEQVENAYFVRLYCAIANPLTVKAGGGKPGVGTSAAAHPTVPSVDGQPNILPVDGEEGIRSNAWHTDVTFVRTPPKVSTLRALVVPPYGGNTLIANAAAAYRDLPAELREFADRLWAVHTNDSAASPSGSWG